MIQKHLKPLKNGRKTPKMSQNRQKMVKNESKLIKIAKVPYTPQLFVLDSSSGYNM